MRLYLIGFATAGLATAASAMPVATFISKFEALEAKGALAVLTSDASLLKQEIQNDATSLRAERLATAAAGKKPAYCPTAEAGKLTLDEIMTGMTAVPATQRAHTDVKDALRAYMAKRFPC